MSVRSKETQMLDNFVSMQYQQLITARNICLRYEENREVSVTRFSVVTMATGWTSSDILVYFIENNRVFYLIGKGGGMYLPSKSALYFVLYMWLKE